MPARVYYLPDEPRRSEHAVNVELVASFDGHHAPSRAAYAAELAEYERSRDFSQYQSIMQERSAVRM